MTSGSIPSRCRLCTTNDQEGLIEELAAALWESCRQAELDPPWEKAGGHWQSAMRAHARTSVALLQRSHEHA